jgi:hypothetical protein
MFHGSILRPQCDENEGRSDEGAWLTHPPLADTLVVVLEFRETAIFTRDVVSLLTDEEYAELQGVLIVQPDAGGVIPGTGGLRKLRWSQKRRGKGKRGGVRVIYYWYVSGALIYMLLAYSKDDQDDLTIAEKRLLARLVAEEFK